MFSHSFKSIITLLKMLSLLEIPYFDLIIATKNKPKVICAGLDTTYILSNKSIIWKALIGSLLENDSFCNLKDAINTVIKFKTLNTAKKHICIIFTDGLFDSYQKKNYKDLINYAEECGINIYGIGLGLYPKGISDIFSKCIWCLNPDLIGKALSVF